MIKANYAYTQMKNALNLKPSHSSENEYLSAYGVFHISDNNVVAVRAANHGTFLYNWLKMSNAPFNIDLLSSANIAITFIDDSIPFTQNNDIIMDDNSKPPVFVVKQYVYNCNNLDVNDLNLIIEASKRLIQNGVYTDPLEDDTNKRATIWREKTNENPKNITSRIIKKHRRSKRNSQSTSEDNKITENKTYNKMKKYIIRKRESDDNMFESLTESEIRRIVREVLNEGLNDVEPVPGFVNVNHLKIEDIEKVYSLCKKAYECIRDVIKITGQENDPYLKYALSGINGFGNSVRMELDYEKRGNNQVHYKY